MEDSAEYGGHIWLSAISLNLGLNVKHSVTLKMSVLVIYNSNSFHSEGKVVGDPSPNFGGRVPHVPNGMTPLIQSSVCHVNGNGSDLR